MLVDAFNAILRMHSRPATLRRLKLKTDNPPSISTSCRITPSNYFRKVEGISHTVIEGREFIISKASIESPFDAPIIKRGDRIEDPDLGHMAIIEVNEMYDFGGALMGFRCRVE